MFSNRYQPLWLFVLLLCLVVGRVGATQDDENAPKTPEDRLFYAIGEDNIKTVRALLQRGVNPNAPNRWKTPPLEEAVDRGRELEMVKLLLDYRADPNAVNESFHRTPLMAAVSGLRNGRWQVESHLKVIDLLLKQGANINLKVGEETALTASMGYYAEGEIVRALIARGADITVPGHDKYTPLHYLACAGETTRVQQLLQAGVDVNVRDTFGTPLFHAVMAGNTETVRALLEAKADPNTRAYDDRHVLSLSFSHRTSGNPVAEIPLLLVQYGANVNVRDKDGYGAETPLISALKFWISNDAEAVDRLIAQLLERGANVNAQDHRCTVLMYAIEREHFNRYVQRVQSWVKPLLDRGANVNAKTQYQTTLHAAIERERKSLDIPRLLLDRGADVNMTLTDHDTGTKGGITVLMSALQQQDFGFAKLLVERSANIHCTDNAGKMPIHWAAFYGEKELVRMLLARGANLNARDKIGQNALDLAIKGKQPEVTALLRARGASKSAAPTIVTNARGQVIVRLPVKWKNGPVPPADVTFTAELKEDAPGLLIRRGAEIVAEPIRFDPLFTEPGLWPAEERNNHLYQTQRGFYSPDAYQFSGLVPTASGTFLCVRWYSPADSAQHQIAYFVFQLRLDKEGLELTVVRRPPTDVRSNVSLTRSSQLPFLTRTQKGEVQLTDATGVFVYTPEGTWNKIGAPPRIDEGE